jgi:heterodisulfide reductase subunit B
MEVGAMSKMKTYTYFPGCMVPFRLPHFELAARAVLKKLDIELEANPGHACCPEPTTFTGVDFEAWITLAARNVAVSETTGLETVSLCSGCFHTLAVANHMIQEDENLKSRINERLKTAGLKVTGSLIIKNILHVLHGDVGLERIKKEITHPLTGLKIAPHYGCHLVRPLEATHMDDAEQPKWMDDIIEVTGAEVAEFEDKMACCGAPIMPSDADKAFTAIVVVCPTCYTQLETQQKKATAKFDSEYSIPVLYLGELLAISMGMKDMVISNARRYHRVKVGPLLEKIGGAT